MIPVIYIHRGKTEYLIQVIQQAVKVCGSHNVFLLGDESNRDCCEKWFSFSDYVKDEYQRLEQAYVHYSYTGEEYERFCLQRYFIMLGFMENRGWSEAYLCDSDLLIYEDLSKLPMQKYDTAFSVCEYPVYYGECASPHCSYWKRDYLEDFTKFLVDIYEHQIQLVDKIYHYHCNHDVLWVSAICDMVWLTGWKQQKVQQGMKFLNMNEECMMAGENVVWDHNLSVSDNAYSNEYCYRRSLHMKKVFFRKEKPYFFKQGGKNVRTLTLHCQGGKKKYILLLTRCSNCYLKYLLTNIIDVCKRRIFQREIKKG
ncbi:MAG: hypothetical protein ACI39R_04625 [Lachnospiraceae bacterium]